MRIESDVKLDYSDVLLRPKRSTLPSRAYVDLQRQFTFRNGQSFYGIPIIAANMDGVGEVSVARVLSSHGLMTCLTKTTPQEDIINILLNNDTVPAGSIAVTVGVDVDFTFIDSIKKQLKYLCVDVANGYTQHFINVIKKLRDKLPDVTIIAGNVATGEMVEELLLSGADIVKIGIGPGSACRTRIQTGVGYPQFSAVAECSDAAHGLNGHIIADGGCVSPGDVAKAFGAGADFVMLGSMLAGCAEGGGKIIKKKTGDKYVEFYGMSSKTANEKHFGGLKDYRASEGRTVHIPFKGKIADVVLDILGGLRSACTYVGANKLKNLSKCATFVRVNNTHSKLLEKYTVST